MKRSVYLALAGVLVAVCAVGVLAQTTIHTDGDVEAQGFIGDGSQVTNVNADQLDGMEASDLANAAATAGELANLQMQIDDLDTRMGRFTRWIFIPANQLLDPYSTTSDGTFAERVERGAYPAVVFPPSENWEISFAFPVPPDWTGDTPFNVDLLFSGTASMGPNSAFVEWGFLHRAAAPGDNVPIGSVWSFPRNSMGAFYTAGDLLVFTVEQLPVYGFSLAGKTMVGVRLARAGTLSGDTYSGSIELYAVRIRYDATH